MFDLRRYVPVGRVSTGLVGWWEGRLAWAVGQRKYWRERDGRALVPVTGARRTVWARGEAPGDATLVDLGPELAGEPAPLLVWQVPVTLVRDDGTPYRRDYICAVYEAVFERRPRPTADTPGVFRTGLGASYEGLPLPPGVAFFPQGSTLFVVRHWDRLEATGPLRAWVPAGGGARPPDRAARERRPREGE